MRVVLIQPPIEDFYTTPIRLYPLGLLYVAAVLRSYGHEVTILDALTPPRKRTLPLPKEFAHLKPHLNRNPYFFKQFYRFGWSDEEILQKIREIQPEAIGIAANFTAYFKNVADLTRKIKQHISASVFIGGHHATVFADEIRNRLPEVDEIVAGPAEKGLQNTFLSDGKKGSMDWRELQPPHHLLPAAWYRIGRQRAISLTASRGCPFRCDFCSVHALFGRKMSFRSPESVVAEMIHNYRHRQVRIFNFEDDNLTVNRNWFTELLNRIVTESELSDIELTAMNGLCYTELDGDLLALMKRAGFRRLDLSYVTQDEALQKQLNRPESSRDRREQLVEIVRRAKQLGLFVTVYMILGLPDQTEEEIEETVSFLTDLDVLIGPSVFYLPPGSALYGRLVLPPEIRDNWNLYRSTAFAVATPHLSRQKLVEWFCRIRKQNLEQKMKW